MQHRGEINNEKISFEDNIYHKQPIQKINSQFHHQYNQLQSSFTIDKSRNQQKLQMSNISYNQNSTYQLFNFDVEKVFNSFPFYRINVKIAHFNLSVNVVKHPSYGLIQTSSKCQGNFGEIYFINYEHLQICIKSFSFRNADDFQQKFAMAIKEWSILKICSSLQCAPYIENFFGFDIIIYDDCIQFACEKGQKIIQMTSIQQKQLKESLKIMHSFKIIHFDVKPENVIFSKHYQRAVFIDFGFSQIIKEECGYKTFSIFKGTPNYSSPQVLSIMDEAQSFVDLYYNDAFGLNIVILQKRPNKNKNSILAEFINDDQDQQDRNQLFSEFKKVDFIFFNFQYHYLNGNQSKSREYLLRILLYDQGQNQSKVLTFMKSVMKDILISPIFTNDLKKFSNKAQYKQIESYFKFNVEKLYIKPDFIEQLPAYQQKESYTKIQPCSFNGTAIFTLPDFAHYSKLIMEVVSFQQKTIDCYLSLAFESLRFDIKNIDFISKVTLTNKIIPLLSAFMNRQGNFLQVNITNSQEEFDQRQGVQRIKSFMFLLYQFCIENSSVNWGKAKICDIFQQMILLDVDIFQFIDSFLIYVDKHFQEATGHILAAMQCTRLLQTVKTISTQHIQKMQEISNKFQTFIQRQMQKFRQQSNAGNDLQIQVIRNIVDSLQNFNDKKTDQSFSFEHEQNLIKSIRNTKIRRYLMSNLLDHIIQEDYSLDSNSELLKLIYHAKNSQLRKLDFFSYVRITLKLLHTTHSFKDIKDFCNQITAVVNCKTINNRIICNVMRQSNQLNVSALSFQIKELKRIYPHIIMNDSSIDLNIYEIFMKIKTYKRQKVHVFKKLYSQLYQLYLLYQQYHHKKHKCPYQKIHHFLFIFYHAEIQFSFYQLSSQTQSVFNKNLSLSQSLLKEVNRGMDDLNALSIQFRHQMYSSKYHYAKNQYQNYIKSQCRIIQFCEKLNINYLALQMLQSLIVFTWRLDFDIVTVYLTIELFNLCKKLNYFWLYLQQFNYSCSLASLLALACYNHDIFIELNLQLTNILTKNPIDGYIKAYLKLIDKFITYPMQKDILYYKKFIESGGVNIKLIPYLLIFYVHSLEIEENQREKLKLFKIITLNLERLNGIAIKNLLQKYFYLYLTFISEYKFYKKKKYLFREAKRYLKAKDCIALFGETFKVKIYKKGKSFFINNKLRQKMTNFSDNILS